jgi:PAS domain S-box-containing protein
MSLAPSPANLLDTTQTEYRGSLRRTFIIWLVILTLIPAILVIATNYIRNRDLITEQVSSQLQTIAENSREQLIQVGMFVQNYLTEMLGSSTVSSSLSELAAKPDAQSTQFNANMQLFSYIQGKRELGGTRIDHITIVNSSGIVISSTNNQWQGQNYGENPVIRDLIGAEKTLAAFNTAPLYPNQLVIYSSKILYDTNGAPAATVILSATSTIPNLTITTARSFYAESRAYYYTRDNLTLELDNNNIYKALINSSNLDATLRSMMASGGALQSYVSQGDIAVIGYALWMPDLSLGLIVEAREDIIYQQINSQIPFNFLLVFIAMLATIVVVFIGSNQLVRPLILLAQIGRSFAQGFTHERVEVRRKDEIGIITNSFNQMADQIRFQEENLESLLDQRTQAMRTGADIARQGTGTTKRQELIDRTCQLLVDKFGFSFASMFIVDENRTYAVLQGISKIKDPPKIPDNYRLNVAADTLVGWVALNNQMRAVQNFEAEPAFRSLLSTKKTMAEIALPIRGSLVSTEGKSEETNEILGVLSIQSSEVDRFDASIASVLENLATQISSGLQNIQAFEATEFNLEEIKMLYSTSRRIVQSENEKELIQILSGALAQTNYVSGIFSVESYYLSVLGIIDPRSPNVTSAQGITLPLQKIGRKVERNSMVLVESLTQQSEYDNLLSFFSRRGCRSAALFFVFNQENLSKIFVVGSRDLNPLQAEKLQPFTNLVGVMSTTLEHFQIMNKLEQRLNELQTLAQVSKVISAETDVDQLYKLLHAEMSQAFGADVHFLIATYDEKSNLIHIPYIFDGVSQLSVEPFPLGQGMTSILIRNREPLLLVKDTERKAAELGAKIVGKTAKSWLGVPLIVGGHVLGAMVLQDTDKEERFNENDLRLMVTLSSPVAIAIRNAQLLTEMQEALRAYDQERFLLNVLLENIPDLIYFKDSQGKFIRASNSTIAKFGLNSSEEIRGKTVYELELNEDDSVKAALFEEEITSTGQAQINNQVQYHPNEENESWALVSKIPLFNNTEQLVGILGIESDITSLKRTEQIAQRRAQQILTASEIARDTTTELNVDEILNKSVNLIRDRFGFYHASIFLLDPLKEFAVLRESTGEVGRMMKERGHRLAVGSQSIVGRATANRQPLIINDVTQDPNYFANPLLPDTRSELAIPLQVGIELLGAIDVQSNRLNAFSDEDVSILQILADQLAVALLNANLFTEARETLEQHRALHNITNQASTVDNMDRAVEIIAQSLKRLRESDRVIVFLLNANNQLVVQASAGYEDTDLSNLRVSIGEGVVGKVAQTRKPYRVEDITTDRSYIPIDSETRSELAVPILYADHLMGVVNIENPSPAAYDENDQEIIATLGTNLGTILANTQLVAEVRQQVDRQRQLYEITSKIRRSVDIQTIIQTFTTEVCNAMQARKATVQITAGFSPERLDNIHENQAGERDTGSGNGHKYEEAA